MRILLPILAARPLAACALALLVTSSPASAQSWLNMPASRIQPGAAANASSASPVISQDGRWIAFNSGANNLVQGQVDPSETDVFLHDRQTNTMTLVSHAADDPLRSSSPGFSQVKATTAFGTTLFDSTAPFLIPGQTAGFVANTYIHTAFDGNNLLISHAVGQPGVRSNGECRGRIIDANAVAAVIACTSTNLQAGIADGNGTHDLYLYEKDLDRNTLITHAASGLTTASNLGVDAFNGRVAMSGERRWVAFTSPSTNLVGGSDTNSAEDVFVYDTQDGSIRLVSHVAGDPNGAGASGASLVSLRDGIVMFNSSNANHVAGATDTNGASDVFSYDIASGAITLVTHAAGAPLVAANGASFAVPGGSVQRVLVETTATNLMNGLSGAITRDVMIWNRVGPSFQLVSHAAAGATVRANAAARAVASNLHTTRAVFESTATNVVAGFAAPLTNASNLYEYDWQTATTQLVTHANGAPATGSTRAADPVSIKLDESGDGVVLSTPAGDLSASADGNAVPDVYVHDRGANAATLVSKAAFALAASAGRQTVPVGISADGRYVVQNSNADDLGFDQIEADNDSDVFVYDGNTGEQTLVSCSIAGFEVLTNVPANAPSTAKAISRDGNWILFSSAATNLIAFPNDANGAADVFLAARSGGINLVSHASNGTNVAGNAAAAPVGLSGDGRWVLYESNASNAITGTTDANGTTDVFLYDRFEGQSVLVSKAWNAPATAANDVSRAIALTPDGRYALFQSRATNLVNGFTNLNGPGDDVYLYDRDTGTSRLVSAELSNPTRGANAAASAAALSDDGDLVVFNSSAGNLIANGTSNGLSQVFVRRLFDNSTRMASHAVASTSEPGNGTAIPLALSGDGSYLLFSSTASNIVPDFVDGNGAAPDIYISQPSGNFNMLFSRSNGSLTNGSNREWRDLHFSLDRSHVAFSTLASDVIQGVNPGSFFAQVYQIRLDNGTKSLVSHRDGGPQVANQNSGTPLMNVDGSRVAYESNSSDLAAWVDLNSARDTFVAQRFDGFVVTPVVTGTGAIDPSGPQTVAAGATVTFTLTPGVGQRVESAVGCGGTLVGNAFTTAPASADCTVTFAFVPLQFTLRYLVDPAQGTINGATTQTVDYDGSGSQVVAQPNAGWQFSQWSDGRLGAVRTDANVTADLTVTAEFTVQRVNLLYTAGAGGTVNGQPSVFVQIDYGQDGPTVTAMPDNGQAFVRWSDGVLSAQRTDLDVTANISVEAEFGASPNFTVTPVVGANGSINPNQPQSVAPGGTTFFDLSPNAGYRIGGAGGCNGSLVGNRFTTGPVNANCTVTFAFNRIPVAQDGTLDAVEDGGSYSGNLVGIDDDPFAYVLVQTPAKGSLILQPSGQYFYAPNADANGADSFRFRINDGVQDSNEATVAITIAAVNDRPAFALNPATLPEHAQGTSGPQTRAGILANVDFGPPDEDASQAIASVQAFETFDPANILASVSISNAGLLAYTLTGGAGVARVNVTLTDNGGTANGGAATSESQQLTLSVRNATDLEVSDSNGAASVAPGQPVVYEVLVANAGPYATTAAQLDVPVPAGLGNVLWSCNAIALATCPQPDGTGAIAALSLDLPTNGVLRFLVTGNVTAPAGATLTHTATIATTGPMFEVDASDNIASDTDPVAEPVDFVFGDGFETAVRISVPVPAAALLYPRD